MMRLLSATALLMSALVMAQAQTQTATVTPGQRADAIDSAMQENITQAIQDKFTDWKLESVREEEENSSASMTWVAGQQHIIIHISYLASRQEATKQLSANLSTIQVPRYKPFAGVGEQAYLIKPDGPVMFRQANTVVTVWGCDARLDVIEQFARWIADTVTAG